MDPRDGRSRCSVKSRRSQSSLGGVALVSKATGLSVNTVRRGLSELDEPAGDPSSRRIRKTGGGRKSLREKDPGLVDALEGLVEPFTRGDPMRPLRWTCKSVRRLAGELNNQGHAISPAKVAELLAELGYSLQSHRKRDEGNGYEDRDAQFCHITQNWRGKALVSQKVIVDLIAATTTSSGLKVQAERDESRYQRSSPPPTRWPQSKSPTPTSMENGTTPSTREPLNKFMMRAQKGVFATLPSLQTNDLRCNNRPFWDFLRRVIHGIFGRILKANMPPFRVGVVSRRDVVRAIAPIPLQRRRCIAGSGKANVDRPCFTATSSHNGDKLRAAISPLDLEHFLTRLHDNLAGVLGQQEKGIQKGFAVLGDCAPGTLEGRALAQFRRQERWLLPGLEALERLLDRFPSHPCPRPAFAFLVDDDLEPLVAVAAGPEHAVN